MTPSHNIITLQSAKIAKGVRAWKTIKSTAAEQRQLWRDVGDALLEGRVMYPANQAFGAWCANEGFDMDRRVRADAMWLAGNWASLSNGWTTGDTHPTALRTAFKPDVAPPSPDLDISAPADVALERIAKVAPNARRVTALAAHAAGTGPEAETARKYLRKQAADKGMTVEELVDMAEKLDPLSKVTVEHRDLMSQAITALSEHIMLSIAVLQHNKGMTAEFLIATLYSQLKAKGL